jgi:chromosome segregation ATPase
MRGLRPASGDTSKARPRAPENDMADRVRAKSKNSAAEAVHAAAAIQRAADGATEEIAILRGDLAGRDAEISRLQEVADERRRVIDELTEYAAAYRRAAEARGGLLASLDFETKQLRVDLQRGVDERNAAIAAAEATTQTLDEERHRALIELQERDAQIRSAHRDAEAARARLEILENAVAVRGKLIDELQAACEERLEVIERLSDEVASLRTVAEERALLLASNEAEYRARETKLAASGRTTAPTDSEWRELAEERERALQELGAEAERRSVLLAEVTAALEGRTREVEDLRKRLTRAS